MLTETKDFDDTGSDDFEGSYEVLTLSSDGVFFSSSQSFGGCCREHPNRCIIFNGIDSIYPLNISLQERY